MKNAERIRVLISKMTLEEKVSQLSDVSPAIERLGIPEYNWWNEGLHGVARAGVATIFPQAIALASIFDEDFMKKVFTAVSDEARAKYNEASKRGVRTRYYGLTYWTPNINIFRDPRWGRGQETYGEDPFLTARLGVACVQGLQGDHPERLKIAACAKHYAVHSGPERLRHEFDAVVTQKDLWETYLPAFKALVDAGVETVMGAYNRTLGEPCCGSAYLLKDILRGRWRFKGHVVSDCWAIRDFHLYHKVTSTVEESVALALNSGCDLNCGSCYPALVPAVQKGLVTEETINTSLERLLSTRFKLGQFDPVDTDPWAALGKETIRCEKHLELAREAAEKSIVLLKNRNNLLPLDDSKKKIFLIGPGAANLHTLTGNYHGLSPRIVTILEGLTGKISEKWQISMDYHQGCMMYDENKNMGWTVGMAEQADVVIAVFGLDNAMEGEEGDAIATDSKGDRDTIELPEWQLGYLKALSERGKPIVLVLTGGSPIAIPEEIADAVLFVWYPGEQGGNAVANVIFGDAVPSGHLPLTFPQSTRQLPPYEDYSMQGRTYRFMEEEPYRPFGFGLSYTTFRFDALEVSGTVSDNAFVTARVTVRNTGKRDAEEVVQLYLSRKDRTQKEPLYSLRGFSRVSIQAGSSRTVELTLDAASFSVVQESGESILARGLWSIIASDAAPHSVALVHGASKPIIKEIMI